MQRGFLHEALIGQERRSIRLYLILFYCLYVLYDGVFYFLIPMLNDMPMGFPNLTVSIVSYFVFFLLIPYSIYMMRQGKPSSIKYTYFITYVIVATITGYMIYSSQDGTYSEGNIVELFFVLFSPIFVNKRFFWVVTTGLILRYTIIGLLLLTPRVFIPIFLVMLFSVVAYIILNRFIAYIDAVQNSYASQLEGIVRGIIMTLELKDPYTRGHSERVAHYSQLIARDIGGFSELELKSFYNACLLHDVGKVHIPDSILLKSTSLTEDEFEIIKTHTTVGAEVIQGIQGLEYTVDVIRHHHERWDGRGYPDHLHGSQIPLLARITAIADAFDAMTSVRSYRSAMNEQHAYTQILEGSGTQFDPNLIKHFQQVFPAMKEYLQQQSHYQNAVVMNAREVANNLD